MSPRPLPPAERRTTARTRREAATGVVVGYLRVSTQEQADSGLGLAAQRTAISAIATARGWSVLWCIDEGVSGSVAPEDRPGMREALALLASGEAAALVVSKLDRCSRDTHDFTGLLKRSTREGWAFSALDLGVDTTTPVGRMVAEIMIAVAQWERSVIRQRTRDALAVKKAAGVRLGAPIRTDAAVRQRIRDLRHDGLTLAEIADSLNAEGTTTATGCAFTWHNVRRILGSLRLDDAALLASEAS